MAPISGREQDAVRKQLMVWLLLALTMMGLTWTASAQQGTVLTGLLSATDVEMEEGYFALGQELMVVAKPGSPFHKWLSAHKDQRVVLTLDTVSSH
jgi:hypothetical protein